MTRRDVSLTVCTWVLVPAFLALCYWQVTRALGGNDLSWAYVFEWPIFAGYLIHVWWKLIHEDSAGSTPSAADHDTGQGGRGEASVRSGEQEDEELAAYNRYLAALEESGRRKRW